MKDLPSCFGENGVQVADASCTTVTVSTTKASQNLVASTYLCNLLGKSRLIVVTWSKNLVGHCFSVEIEDFSQKGLCRIDVKPSLFSKRKGSKHLEVGSVLIDVYWDLIGAKFGSSPEPLEGFYLGIACKGEMVLLIGDLGGEILKKTNGVQCNFLCVSKREHVFGKEVFATKARFSEHGEVHEFRIECDTIGLVVRLDSKMVLQVKHLVWKFRGNYTILVDGVPVEVYWDVHNWLFGSVLGSAVFMFKTCSAALKGEAFESPGCGFSLILYAWKTD